MLKISLWIFSNGCVLVQVYLSNISVYKQAIHLLSDGRSERTEKVIENNNNYPLYIYPQIHTHTHTHTHTQTHVCLSQSHRLSHIMSVYESCWNIKSDHFDLEAFD